MTSSRNTQYRNASAPTTLQYQLAYNEMTVGNNGSVMSRQEKIVLRDRHGFCKECTGPPVLLYKIKKSRLNPLWVTKEALNVAKECADGVCFACHPERDPNSRSSRGRRKRHQSTHEGQERVPAVANGSTAEPNHQPSQPIVLLGELIPEVRPADDAANPDASLPANRPHPRSTRPDVFVPDSMRDTPTSGASGDMSSFNSSNSSIPAARHPPSNAAGDDTNIDSSGIYTSRSNVINRLGSSQNISEELAASIGEPESLTAESQGMRETSDASFSSLASGSGTALASSTAEIAQTNSANTNNSVEQSVSTSAAPAAAHLPTLSESEVDSIIDGVDSLIRDMMAAEESSDFLSEIILGTMREHSSVPAIQLYCLRVIWDVCKESSSNRYSILSDGAPEYIMKALKAFPDDAGVQEKGCGAIWSLGVNANNRVILIRAGACARIVTALRLFIGTESLVRTAIGAMRTLSPELEAREAFKIMRASVVTAEAMVVHRPCASIQRDGCAFLSNCAVNIEKQFVMVVPKEELEAVVQAMAYHRQEPSVLQGACFALKNYSHEEKNCRILRQCKGIDELLDHASKFQVGGCQEDAGDTQERLQLSKSLDESMEDQAYVSLLHIVDSQATTPQAPKSILDFMRNYDWSARIVAAGLQMFKRIIDETENSGDPQRNRVYESGNLEEVMRYCQKYDRSQQVCEEACILLACLATQNHRHATIIEAGACSILFKSLEFRSNENLVKNAFEALKLMATNAECHRQVKLKMAIITDAIAAHPTSEMVNVNGIAVVSSLDYV